jgi:hypothetical protein
MLLEHEAGQQKLGEESLPCILLEMHPTDNANKPCSRRKYDYSPSFTVTKSRNRRSNTANIKTLHCTRSGAVPPTSDPPAYFTKSRAVLLHALKALGERR